MVLRATSRRPKVEKSQGKVKKALTRMVGAMATRVASKELVS